jgi:hypothetical protein
MLRRDLVGPVELEASLGFGLREPLELRIAEAERIVPFGAGRLLQARRVPARGG